MIIGIFVTVAVILIAFGGLLAAADAALSVLSRTDLVELAATSRSKRSLIGIAKDVGAHVNAINFMRVVSETTAAVLVTLSLAYSIPDWWWALLVAAVIMIVVSFVLVGTSPRSVGPGERAADHRVRGADHPGGARHPRPDRERARRARQPGDARAARPPSRSRARSSC